MTFLDQKRAEAQKAYQLEQKYYKEHEEEYKRYVTISSGTNANAMAMQPW
jgi:hypothetical protein